jgi:sarcosine oxidase subunit alpha
MNLKVDLAVVGAGPAGLMAATTAAESGLKVIVLDEYPRPGGRLLGQLHEERQPDGRMHWWKGGEVAQEMVARATSAGVQIMNSVQVWGLDPGWTVQLSGQAHDTTPGPLAVQAGAVVLATGAGERALAVPGWTLPGVMTVGAAQVFANVHRVSPGKRVLIVGVDPLSLTVARELMLAGSQVLGLVLPPAGQLAGELALPEAIIGQLARFAHLAPSPLLRLAGRLFPGAAGARLGARLYPRSGVRAWGIPLWLRTALVRVVGDEQVRGAVVTDITPSGLPVPGTERELQVDCVTLSGGLSPVMELAAAAGCRLVPSGLGGLVPLHGPTMETELPGLLVAGSITGVEGARVAIAQGRIAGVTALHRLGAISSDQYAQRLAESQAELDKIRNGAAIQFYPHVDQARRSLGELWRASQGETAAD